MTDIRLASGQGAFYTSKKGRAQDICGYAWEQGWFNMLTFQWLLLDPFDNDFAKFKRKEKAKCVRNRDSP